MPGFNEQEKEDPEKFFSKEAIEKFAKREEGEFLGGFKPESNQTEQLVLRIQLLEAQVQELTLYFKSVFDGHVLIDGVFRKITP